jgi:hypothetical protein
MYEEFSKDQCPYTSLEKYIKSLPSSTKDDTIFPKAVKSGWSQHAVVGKDTLGNLMPNLSKNANLSRRYTNHSIRVTVVNILKDSGFNDADICSITGHKNQLSVQKYVRGTETRLLSASEALSRAGEPKEYENEKRSESPLIVGSEEMSLVASSTSNQLCEAKSQSEAGNTFLMQVDGYQSKKPKLVFSGVFNNCTFHC